MQPRQTSQKVFFFNFGHNSLFLAPPKWSCWPEKKEFGFTWWTVDFHIWFAPPGGCRCRRSAAVPVVMRAASPSATAAASHGVVVLESTRWAAGTWAIIPIANKTALPLLEMIARPILSKFNISDKFHNFLYIENKDWCIVESSKKKTTCKFDVVIKLWPTWAGRCRTKLRSRLKNCHVSREK